MSNLGKWNKWYESVTDQMPFGDSESYVIGAKFLEDCEVVEDWGCGLGWFSKFRPNGYLGVDGSDSPFASKIVDLEEYTSFVDGIFMRHVLEHNYGWKTILANALKSFRKKMVVVVFTPWSPGNTREISFVDRVGVPNISFNKQEFLERLVEFEWELIELTLSNTMFGQEHIFLVQKNEKNQFRDPTVDA